MKRRFMKRRLTRMTLLTSLLLAAVGCVPEDEAAEPGPTNPGPGPVGPIQGINVLSISEENGLTIEPDTVRIERVHLEDWPGYLAIHADEGGAPGAVLGVERVQPRRRNYVTVTLDAPLNARQTLWAVAYADIENTNTFSTDLPIVQGESSPLQAAFDLYFQSTTTVEDSPYYQYPCPFEQWREDPTDFFVDCRCAPNQVSLEICRPPHAQSMLYAEGPRLATLPQDHKARGGVVHEPTGEVIYGVRWQDENHTDPGLIFAVNYTTGDRRIVSGRWVDPNAGYEVIGEGPELHEPMDVELGPDGALYVYAWKDDTNSVDGVSIIRVDVQTGDRTLVWGAKNPAFGQCDNGAMPPQTTDPQFWRYAFTMDPDGNFYLPTISNGRPRSGRGIVQISADGTSCRYVTMDGAAEGNAYYPSVGEGYPVGQFNYEGMAWHDGYLYSINNGDLIRIDPQNGDRRRVAGEGATPVSSNVSGRFLQWNPEWNLLMVSGMLEQLEFVGGVDLETGKVHAFASCLNIADDNPFATDCFEGAGAPLGRSERAMLVLPNGLWLQAHGNGFVLIEPRTGNSYILSY